MILPILALVLTPHTGILKGHVSIGPLTAAERKKNHTQYEKKQSIAGYELQIYAGNRSPAEGGQPVEDIALKEDGKFKFQLPPGLYIIDVTKSMHAGAYSIYPEKMANVRSGKTTRVLLHVRSDSYK